MLKSNLSTHNPIPFDHQSKFRKSRERHVSNEKSRYYVKLCTYFTLPSGPTLQQSKNDLVMIAFNSILKSDVF